MAPTWLTTVAWCYLGVCLVCAAAVTYDIFFNRRRQPMGVMDAVYPITALYFGPFAFALYGLWARSPARPAAVLNPRSGSAEPQMARAPHMAVATAGHDTRHAHAKPRWVSMAIEVSHCGAGCTLGDLIAEWLIFALALTIAGRALFAEYAGDYALALALGILFQYFAIAPMRGLDLEDGLIAAAKADFISLSCFEIGLFGWMALMTFVYFPAPHHLMPSSATYWFLMQIGMIVGFFTSWPANVWLVNRGIKVLM
jgi:hypothetical protein